MSRSLSKALEVISVNPDINIKLLCDMLDISERTAYRAKARYKEIVKNDESFPRGYQEPCKALVLGDLHIPQVNTRAVDVAIEWGLEQKVNVIVLNGDILDANSISSHPKNPMDSTLANDIETARRFLQDTRNKFPTQKIFYLSSNHEEDRLFRFLQSKAPELFDLDILSFPNLLGLKDLNIHYVDNSERILAGMEPFSIGRLNIDHGDNTGVKSALNTARAIYLKTNCSILCHHFHRSESKIFRRFDGSLARVVCVGCLTNINPSYIKNSNHNLGCAIVETYDNHFFSVDNKIILDVYGDYKIMNA